jgi:predicted transcriptional regulator
MSRTTLDKLMEIKGIFNITELADRSGIKINTLYQKLSLGRDLKEKEIMAIKEVLKEYVDILNDIIKP